MTTVHHLINVLGSAHGGAEIVATSLNDGLKGRGWDSRLVAIKGVEADPDEVHSLGHRSPYDPSAVLSIRRYLKCQGAKGDILHAHLFPSNLFAALAKQLSSWKGYLVTTEHSTSNRRRGSFLGGLLDGYTYGRYDRIFCISDDTRCALENWDRRVEARTRVIENGVALRREKPRSRFSSSPPCIVVSMGRLHPVKNYEAALRAVAMLGEREFEYWIMGTGPLESSLKALAEELGVAHKVRFLGYVEEPHLVLEKADVYLITSKWEGFGLAAVEAMNAGLPVVASDVPGLREVVNLDGTGAGLVPPDCPASIAKEVDRLICSTELRERRGAAGFERSFDFSVDSMVSSYVEEYQSLLEERSRLVR